ncbi:hypothetical protein IU449_28530 [Nocardia higoensis]|uniref:Uncharacterized protein n=1 Tax=Nocardia higoensis TaxID=228599 RepID=A0ABS0DJ04_9NOCA|nr:hypothetical protein [Nocardia higoensis]MBF6358447.1 hypothetical protein [Nocardia higoensis]
MTGTPRSKQQQFSFRLEESTATAFREKLESEFVRQQDVLQTLAAAWTAGLVDLRELRAAIAKTSAAE